MEITSSRNLPPSRPGSLVDGFVQRCNEKPLKRSITIAGISTPTQLRPSLDLPKQLPDKLAFPEKGNNSYYTPFFRAKDIENMKEISPQDENLGVQSNSTAEFNTPNRANSKNIPGLYPRKSIEKRTLSTQTFKTINLSGSNLHHQRHLRNELSISIKEHQVETTISLDSPFSTFDNFVPQTYDSLSTIKNNNLDETIKLIETDDFPYKDEEKRKYTHVEIEPTNIELLDDEASLNLDLVSRKLVPYASPFFQTIEFDPCEPTDTGILLKILNYEFEHINEEDEAFANDSINEYENRRIPWYRQAFNFVKYYNDFINSFKPLTKEEYNAKYPWEKFYDPELYFDTDLSDSDEGQLNMEMIPNQLQNSMSAEISDSMKTYSYIKRRRGY